ncbi:tRNA (adenosine(37)-N6)-dimethylallyltransferase MiaA [bacterium]|nr:tRNA (adenosine(37)-N6)-dimethylallyltransferase MiaA [bacterium]
MKKNLLTNNLIAVVGPTASGKTSYAIELAKKVDGEIISADSRLVYKGFDIGTAKPSKDEMSEIPHHMIDIVEPKFSYSAGLYQQQAKKVIEDVISRGKIPIVVGGTGLYIDILLKNYHMPKIEPDYELRKQLEMLEFEDLYNILEGIDPKTAKRIEQNDKKKLIRSIEIIKQTGKTLEQARSIGEKEYNIKWIGLNFERNELYKRINKRVDLMIEKGLIDETKELLNKHGRIPNIIDTIGYKEIIKYLDGIYDINTATEELKKNTRHYAKRQMTWFRKNTEIEWNIFPDRLKK